MIRLFTGFDQRESAGWHVFAQSVIEKCAEPVEIIPLPMGDQRDGSNAFTYNRFLVPYYCGFKGKAIFVDGSDMLLLSDIAGLEALRKDSFAVQVVKHQYVTKHARKYVGTAMEAENADYPRKNWSSVVLWDCAHPLNRCLAPEFVRKQTGKYLHRFTWLPDALIGEVPLEWNWLADEYGANVGAKLLHWTAGIPGIYEYARSAHAQAWFYTAARAKETPLPVFRKATA